MTLYFITGNKNKFLEVKQILPNVEQFVIDLPEIQEIDPHKIIQEKIFVARTHTQDPVIVEDTSLYFDCLHKQLPGPLIKWFMEPLKNQGLYELCNKYQNYGCTAKTIFGYAVNDSVHFFEGSALGTIVPPRGEARFGWDAIFEPAGYDKTYAELSVDAKNKISQRSIALQKLKLFLDKS